MQGLYLSEGKLVLLGNFRFNKCEFLPDSLAGMDSNNNTLLDSDDPYVDNYSCTTK